MNRFALILVATGLLSALTACDNKTAAGGPGAGPGGAPPAQVVVTTAKRQPVAETISLVGDVAANEMVEIQAETDGTVEEILFDEGQRVERGDLLLRLDDSKLAASLAEAKANFDLSKANFERSKQLFQDKLISQQEYDQTASSFALNEASVALRERQLQDTRIQAPFEGVVGARQVSPGQVISKNSTLTWLVDLDPVKVEFHPEERFLSQLQVGQTIEASVATFPGRTFQGKVFFVSPYVDLATRTSLVKAEIQNPDLMLKHGMFANLDLTLTIRENSVVIPEASVNQILENNQAKIYVVDAEMKVGVRTIRIGVRLPGELEVLEGLQGGETVIVEGVQKVAPGSTVTFAPSGEVEPYREVESRIENEKLKMKNEK